MRSTTKLDLAGVRWPLWAGMAAAGGALIYTLLPQQPATTAFPPPPAPAPAPMALPPAAPPPPVAEAAPPAPAVSAAGLILYGVSGGGPAGLAAIIGPASGSPRVVPVGREYRPGLRVSEAGPTWAILVSGGEATRLELGGKSAPAELPRGEAPAPAAPSRSASGGDPAETMAYRLGMQPVAQGGRTIGYVVKPGARLPHLGRAGIAAGDTITSVNGSMLDEERLMELSWTIANSESTEFEVIRNGRKLKLALSR